MFGEHRLRRHPVPMACRIEHSLVVAWGVPAGALDPLVPRGLELDVLDTDDGPWGFLAVAVVEARALRPTGWPEALGRNLVLTGYRVFVRHRDRSGRLRRGLHILRSDTDSSTLRTAGNLLTHYRYRPARIDLGVDGERFAVRIETPGREADLALVATLGGGPAPLPPSSPFPDLRAARRFAGPLPWTFDHEVETGSIIGVRGHRTAWDPRPVAVEVAECTFLDDPARREARLANAFHVAAVDYRWDRGRVLPTAAVPA